MSVYLPMLLALVALLAGLAIGKAWERSKLRDGQWIDRRKARESPHFIVGLDLVVANQLDQAIDELSRASAIDQDALEIHLVLGNLYREKGQVGRAINIHQALLQRPKLKTLEHAYILLCLGLDYRRGGFVDRAYEAFKEVLRLDPKNRHALAQLEKLHEEQHQWAEAYEIRRQLAEIDAGPQRTRDNAILAFLENELGDEAAQAGDRGEAARRYAAAIDRDTSVAPAYLSLGDVKRQEGDLPGAILAWEQLVDNAPDRAYLAFDRLQTAYAAVGAPQRFKLV
jgi:lipopolysaccharide biosynthesis regulator YciM